MSAKSASIETRTDERLHCPACAQVALHRRLYTKNQCTIRQCAQCGLGRAETGNFNPNEYYTDDYFSGRRTDGYADYRGAESILRREFSRSVQFIRKYRPGGRLLDIGCAYGFFLEEATPFYEVAGIEIAEAAAQSCRDRGFRVLTGIADEAAFAQLGMMDVIVLLDVIEHLPNPWATLALCARHLNPDGIVVITTGDFSSAYARLAGRHWRLMTPPQHLWFFTPESLRGMLQTIGLQMESCDHPGKLVPLSLIAFQMRRMMHLRPNRRTAASDIGIPVNLFDAMRCVFRKRNIQP
jgi:2-polyprenyl-3-methyl-5-hydroxy-6-metoxy-1,4-benzoquinol methylase